MRVTLGRGDWRPAHRINGLIRYAFIGDSMVYGAGVAPDQTLPAHTERQLNETIPALPVEAVNLGVSGYNLWNSWLSFKHGPQVYDGVVLVLCNNDAELFSRSFPLVYPKPHDRLWERTHPFGEAVVRCFDDIALFARETSVPVAVVFFNMWEYQSGIGSILGAICSERGICYLDTFPVFRDRNLAREDKVVSKADGHPSTLSHEIVARQLATVLKRQGWFAKYGDPSVEAAPNRILSAAKKMIGKDCYPADAALSWALGALESKSRLAQRMQALDADRGFDSVAAAVAQTLSSASRLWHTSHRLSSYLKAAASSGDEIVASLKCAEEERLRLEEICFALGTGEWERLAAHSFDTAPAQPLATGVIFSEELHFFDECGDDLQRVQAAIASLTFNEPGRSHMGFYNRFLLHAGLQALAALADRVQEQCVRIRSAFERCERALNTAAPALSEARNAHVEGMLGTALRRVKHSFSYIHQWPGVVTGFRDLPGARFTTVEVTLSTNAAWEKTLCLLTAEAEYSVPDRLPFSTNGGFTADGQPMLLKLRLPLFYAGRLLLRTSLLHTPKSSGVEVKFIKVEVYNLDTRRREVPVSSLQKSGNSYVSPILYIS